jgi:hypothetical protein
MFLIRKLGEVSDVDVMRLDILMSYDLSLKMGVAAVRWTDPTGGGPPIRAILVGLLYGRILCIHRETREELFHRVGDLAVHNVRSEGATGFQFAEWVLHVGLGGGNHTLWPWVIEPPEQVLQYEPKIYSAILKLGKPRRKAPLGRYVHLGMPFSLERVLAPSSVLIAISAFSKSCDQETRYYLALLLWQMIAYWGSPERLSLGSEALAFEAAVSAIRSGKLQIP